jgi:hypothetical protein
LLCLAALAPPWVAAESIRAADIRSGTLVPGSISPDKKHCLLEVFASGTTQSAVIFAPTERTANMGLAPLATVWSTDVPYSKRAIVLWSPDGATIALHDSLNKHSTLSIHRMSGGVFASLAVPDLLEAACSTWGINRGDLVSSGQRPLRWNSKDMIVVEVAAKRKAGSKLSTVLQLVVSPAGAVKIIPTPSK